MKKILFVVGTRPEVIKMAPVIKVVSSDSRFQAIVCSTGQHREMLQDALDLFKITPDFSLDVMKPSQSLNDLTCSVLSGLDEVFANVKPDFVVVQGDTTSAMAASLAAYYHKIPVGHIEAGLRTGNIYSPWPEEVNRKIIGSIATLHFAPTNRAKRNLVLENVPEEKIYVTGNTVVDALLEVVKEIEGDIQFIRRMYKNYPFLSNSSRLKYNKRLLLVTGHRRENFGEGFKNICAALAKIAERDDVDIIYPVHLNPNVRESVFKILGGKDNIYLVDPVDYRQFVFLMMKAYLVLTDSGGVQEEAPSLGKPVLVMRNATERDEGIDAGVVKLVGVNCDRIVFETQQLLDNLKEYEQMSRRTQCYGDGKASCRIKDILVDVFFNNNLET